MKRKHNETWMWLMAGLVAAAVSAASCGDDENPAGKPSSSSTGTGGSGATAGSGGSGGSGGAPVGGGGSGGTGGAGGQMGPLGSYPGQPPVMAHDPFGCNMNCLDCHETGNAGAPITPHPERLMCRQCHLPQVTQDLWVDNNF